MKKVIAKRKEVAPTPAFFFNRLKCKRYGTSRGRILSSIITAAVSLGAMTTQAYAERRVRLFVQTPFPWETGTGAPSMKFMEFAGSSSPLVEEGFGLDYDSAEAAVQALINANLPPEISGVEVCTDPCPDVSWWIWPKAKFSFTQRNDPVITQLGASGESRVRVSLPTEVRIDIHADVKAETWFEAPPTVPIDAFVVLGIDASMELSLWPNIHAIEPSIMLSLNDTNVQVELNGVAIGIGAKWGGAVGLVTPLGPVLGAVIGGLLGDAAADAAEERIRAEFSAQVTNAVRRAQQEATAAARAALITATSNVPSPRDTLMAFQVPGMGGATVGELSAVFGSSIELHTVTPGGGLAVSAVQRFAPTPGNGQIAGEIRIPKEVCQYVTTSGDNILYGGMTVPTGRKPTNADLAAAGSQCADKLDASGLTTRVFLGGNPQDALKIGAETRPYWTTNFGNVAFTGAVRDDGNVYSCSFEIKNLPAAAFVEVEAVGSLASRLGEQAFRQRFATVTRPNGSILLNESYAPVPSGPGGSPLPVLGGPQGQCKGGGGQSTGLTQSVLDELEALTDPDRCPQCAVALVPGSENIRVLNAAAVMQTRAGAAVMRELTKQRNLPSRQIIRR